MKTRYKVLILLLTATMYSIAMVLTHLEGYPDIVEAKITIILLIAYTTCLIFGGQFLDNK